MADGLLPGVRRAIVRPSLIAGIAGNPWPGFVQGYAGACGYCIAFGLKFFAGLSSVAYSSDTSMDLIPADIVAALVIAAAAGDPASKEQPAIFHATSSGSHPLAISWAFDKMSRFWALNPPPVSLPFSRFVRMGYRTHNPTAEGIACGRRLAALKLKLLELPLRLSGQQQAVRLLRNGFKAFCVQNSLPYAKSLVCSVENTRRLQMQLEPEERQVWRLVWEPTLMSWEVWSNTFLAAVRQLLLKQDGGIKGLPHSFVMLPAARPEVLRLPVLQKTQCKELATKQGSKPRLQRQRLVL